MTGNVHKDAVNDKFARNWEGPYRVNQSLGNGDSNWNIWIESKSPTLGMPTI